MPNVSFLSNGKQNQRLTVNELWYLEQIRKLYFYRCVYYLQKSHLNCIFLAVKTSQFKGYVAGGTW